MKLETQNTIGEAKISQCRGGKKSNLPPGGAEGSKSIHNGHLIRARETAHGEEEPEGRRAEKRCLPLNIRAEMPESH